ncbi:hypothetical protein [Candidatus Tisiphia endosymbiont of Micropterix aruncella]|uniref:hypothetical protein n=1 Tax=Candidatus Tisiphia endosymbiont of Micropterix aruncella TaxID=3066271 RepID=UPI003AA8C691
MYTAARLIPILGVTDPRQSGKTTLAKMLFSHLPYVSLENLDIRTQARQDLRSFLAHLEINLFVNAFNNVFNDEHFHLKQL